MQLARGFIWITVPRGMMLIPINRILEIYIVGRQTMLRTDFCLYEPSENMEEIALRISEATK